MTDDPQRRWVLIERVSLESGARMRFSPCCAPTTPVARGRGWRQWTRGRGSRTGTRPACEPHVAHFVGSNRHQRSRDHFHQIFRHDDVARTTHKIEPMVDALGPRMEDPHQEEIAARFPEGRPLATEDEITDTMAVCIDGRNAPTEDSERIDDDKRRRHDREFGNAKAASVSALGWDEGDQEALPSNSSSVLRIEHTIARWLDDQPSESGVVRR